MLNLVGTLACVRATISVVPPVATAQAPPSATGPAYPHAKDSSKAIVRNSAGSSQGSAQISATLSRCNAVGLGRCSIAFVRAVIWSLKRTYERDRFLSKSGSRPS
jgi:hypothetical protein